MTIKELKDILNQVPSSMDNVEIFTTIASGCCGDFECLEGIDIDVRLPSGKDEGGLRIDFSTPLPGYRSCIQSGQTLKADKEYWLQHPGSKYYKEIKEIK